MEFKKIDIPGLESVEDGTEYSGESQIFFIDFNGADNVSYENNALDIHIEDISVEDSGLTEEQQFQIISKLNEMFTGTGISFTANAPVDNEYSTIYVGETDAFNCFENLLGIAETIDIGNQNRSDDAFVFTPDTSSTEMIIETIMHEAGHLLGYRHLHEDISDDIYSYATKYFSDGPGDGSGDTFTSVYFVAKNCGSFDQSIVVSGTLLGDLYPMFDSDYNDVYSFISDTTSMSLSAKYTNRDYKVLLYKASSIALVEDRVNSATEIFHEYISSTSTFNVNNLEIGAKYFLVPIIELQSYSTPTDYHITITPTSSGGGGGTTQTVSISVIDSSAGEPSNNGVFRISRTSSTSSSITVSFEVGGTATWGSDYILKKGTSTLFSNSITIPAGSSYVDITLDVIDDNIAEDTETVTFNLANGSSASIYVFDDDSTSSKPDLAPYRPEGWDNKIVFSTVTDTNTDAAVITTNNDIYVDWALKNIGDLTSGAYSVELYVDNAWENTWRYDYSTAGYMRKLEDYNIGSLSSGTHTLKLVLDSANEVSESNEANNEYTRTITVRQNSAGNDDIPVDNIGNTFAGATLIDVSTIFNNSEYVGSGDACDMYRFDVENSGEFDINISGLSARTKLNVYTWTNSRYKKIKGTSSKINKATCQVEAFIDHLLLREGTYYVELMSGDKGKGKCNTDYTLNITPSFFPETTDNNHWLYASEIIPNVRLDGFVGFGDTIDYFKFEVDDWTAFDFDLTGNGKNAKFTVFKWDDRKDKLKKVAKNGLKYGEAHIDNLYLDAGLYYVEILSADKGKGKMNTEYELDITATG